MQIVSYVPPWICRLLACMGALLEYRGNAETLKLKSRGCFGCFSFAKSTQGLTIQGRTVKKPGISEDFWTSSTEIDHSALHSRSISSISAMNQPLDSLSGAGSTSNPPEFVNHGLLLWNQTQQQWLANKPPKTSRKRMQYQEPTLSWSVSYDSLLGTNKRFPQPVPLSEMVDFLVDVWEQDGLYE